MGPNYVSNFSPSASEPWWRRGCMDTMKVCVVVARERWCVNGGIGTITPHSWNHRVGHRSLWAQRCCVCGRHSMNPTQTPTRPPNAYSTYDFSGAKREGRRDSEYTEQTLGAGMGHGGLEKNDVWINDGLAAGLEPTLDIPKCRAKQAGLAISTVADGMIRKAVAKLRFEVMMGPNYVSNVCSSGSEPWWRQGCTDSPGKHNYCAHSTRKGWCVNGGKGLSTPSFFNAERAAQYCCVCGKHSMNPTRTPRGPPRSKEGRNEGELR